MPTLAKNKQAKRNYEFVEEYEGGLQLTGAEVKAAKQGGINLRGAYLSVEGEELWVKNMHIGRYKKAGGQEDYDPTHHRKVLVHRRELRRIAEKRKSAGLTIVPIRVYTKGGLIKIAFALARGKKKHEKRESIKKRQAERRMKEEIKKRRFGS